MVLGASDPTSILLWCGAIAVMLFAVAGGFFAGVVCAPWLQDWAVRRASAEIHKMYELVVAQVERAQRLCAELANVSGGTLSADEWRRLERVQQDFQDTFTRIARACGIEKEKHAAEQLAEKSRPTSFTVEWVRSPVDAPSGLPSQPAYAQNLTALLTQGTETQLASGLLLVRMDKAEGLRRRLGQEPVEKLFSRLASIVVRAARDQDLLCRVNTDTLALLCPSLPALSGTKIAEKIRDHVRNSHFRVDETGAEVLVTASFGYANCGPGDTVELVLDRAADGLDRSQSLGRNQLHVHDGQNRALCRT